MLFQDWQQGSPHYQVLIVTFIIALDLSSVPNTLDYLILLMFFPYQTVLSLLSPYNAEGLGFPGFHPWPSSILSILGDGIHVPHFNDTCALSLSRIWDLSIHKTKLMVFPPNPFLLCSLSEPITSLSIQAPKSEVSKLSMSILFSSFRHSTCHWVLLEFTPEMAVPTSDGK